MSDFYGIIGKENFDKTKLLAFNGKLYNCDEDALLRLYKEQGAGMLSNLQGSFAFVIWDAEKDAHFIARDFFGVKPLYYAQVGDSFLFGGDVKNILKHPDFVAKLNEEALAQYLSFQYNPLAETFFEGVYKLPPGHYLTYKDGEVQLERYFTPRFKPSDMSLDAATKSINEAVDETLKTHISDMTDNEDSDFEIGTFLSGGVDSSLVAARFAQFGGKRCFTVGFDHDRYNEIAYAKELANEIGLEHHTKTITAEEYWDVLPKVQYHMDEPLADPAAVALYFACEEASKHVKAALSGEGADEFFGGYNIYQEPLDLKILTVLPMPIRRLLGRIASIIPFNIKGKNFLIRGSKTVEERFIGGANIFSKQERGQILLNDKGTTPQEICAPIYKEARNQDDITKMQLLDIQMWMVGDILQKADKMSKAHGLELRSPLLDKKIFELASQIPTELRVNKSGTKYAFRRSAAKHLPESWAKRKKLGFPIPTRIWLREEKYYNIVLSHFTGEVAQKYFHTEALVKLLEDHRSQKADNSRKIWTVFMFLIWHKEFFQEDQDDDQQFS